MPNIVDQLKAEEDALRASIEYLNNERNLVIAATNRLRMEVEQLEKKKAKTEKEVGDVAKEYDKTKKKVSDRLKYLKEQDNILEQQRQEGLGKLQEKEEALIKMKEDMDNSLKISEEKHTKMRDKILKEMKFLQSRYITLSNDLKNFIEGTIHKLQ